MLATFIVNSPLDDGGGANLTLREAVTNANASVEAQDIIKFDETVFANGGTITLTQGALSITENNQLIIDGRSSAGVPLGITIDASGSDPTPTENNGDGHTIFNITFSTTGSVEINSLTLTGADSEFDGGAITSRTRIGSLAVKNSVITANAAYYDGGGMEPGHSPGDRLFTLAA